MIRPRRSSTKIPKDDSSYTDAKIHLAYIYERQGKVEKTIDVLKEAIKYKENNTELLRLLASIYREAKRHPEAIEVIKTAIEKNPDEAELYFTIGVLYDDVKMDNEVDTAMRKVIELDPEHTNALNYLGYSYAEKGIKLDEAEEFVKRALKSKAGQPAHPRQPRLDILQEG